MNGPNATAVTDSMCTLESLEIVAAVECAKPDDDDAATFLGGQVASLNIANKLPAYGWLQPY
jgi:hypothetical protein